MTVRIKQKPLEVDLALIIALAGIFVVLRFGLPILEWVCTRNVLKGEW
jgi:hypothetical protein